MVFIEWVIDKLFKHNYWNKEPGAIWGTEQWGNQVTVPNTTIRIQTFGNKVTKKKCKVCGNAVWSNNKAQFCGKFSCWRKIHETHR